METAKMHIAELRICNAILYTHRLLQALASACASCMRLLRASTSGIVWQNILMLNVIPDARHPE